MCSAHPDPETHFVLANRWLLDTPDVEQLRAEIERANAAFLDWLSGGRSEVETLTELSEFIDRTFGTYDLVREHGELAEARRLALTRARNVCDLVEAFRLMSGPMTETPVASRASRYRRELRVLDEHDPILGPPSTPWATSPR